MPGLRRDEFLVSGRTGEGCGALLSPKTFGEVTTDAQHGPLLHAWQLGMRWFHAVTRSFIGIDSKDSKHPEVRVKIVFPIMQLIRIFSSTLLEVTQLKKM